MGVLKALFLGCGTAGCLQTVLAALKRSDGGNRTVLELQHRWMPSTVLATLYRSDGGNRRTVLDLRHCWRPIVLEAFNSADSTLYGLWRGQQPFGGGGDVFGG